MPLSSTQPLYLFMDIFSRKIVGWQVYETESSNLASEVMQDICERENIPPHQVVLHSDNGVLRRNPRKFCRAKPTTAARSFRRYLTAILHASCRAFFFQMGASALR